MRFFFPFVLILTLLAAGVYAWLGGFRSPAVALETNTPQLLLAGQFFRGPAQAEEFGPLFRQAKEVQDRGPLTGPLTNLYFDNPEKAHDTIRAFVGLLVADSSQPLPAGWRYRVVPAGQRVVAARLHGVSYLLSPGKLYPAAFEGITKAGQKPRDFYLEKFGPGDDAEVWAGVQ